MVGISVGVGVLLCAIFQVRQSVWWPSQLQVLNPAARGSFARFWSSPRPGNTTRARANNSHRENDRQRFVRLVANDSGICSCEDASLHADPYFQRHTYLGARARTSWPAVPAWQEALAFTPTEFQRWKNQQTAMLLGGSDRSAWDGWQWLSRGSFGTTSQGIVAW